MPSLFIFGMGFSASLFAEQALSKGWSVQATSRTVEGKENWIEKGVEIHAFDGTQAIEDFEEHMAGVTHILHSVPPLRREAVDPVLKFHEADIKAIESLEWLGYLSTTGVYGNADGAWVNELSPCNPTSQRSKARKKVEEDWLNCDLPVHIFRLAGIYGPGRSLLDSVREGKMRAISKPNHVFSRIHRDDIAGVLWSSIANPSKNEIYNVCDDQPIEPYEVLVAACELLKVTPPEPRPFEEVSKEMSEMAKSFWNDNKKVQNQKIKLELGYDLKYPGFKEGLRAILAAGS